MTNLLNNPGITIFGFTIYYYAICIVTGMIISTVLSGVLMRRRNISYDNLLLLFIICIPSAIVGARLLYCLMDGYIQRGEPFIAWINTRDGGLSVIGGIMFGVLAGLFVCLAKKQNFFRMADCVVPTIPLAQAIGRWGNFFNQEVYGGIANESLQFFPFAVYIDRVGEWHYALFFWEGLLNLILFTVLFVFAWKNAKKPNGLLTGAMILGYGIIRTVMEPLRDPSYILNGNGSDFMLSQIFSIGGIVLGAAIIIYALVNNKVKEGKFFGSAKGDPYVLREYIPSTKSGEDKPKYDKWNLAAKLYNLGDFESGKKSEPVCEDEAFEGDESDPDCGEES